MGRRQAGKNRRAFSNEWSSKGEPSRSAAENPFVRDFDFQRRQNGRSTALASQRIRKFQRFRREAGEIRILLQGGKTRSWNQLRLEDVLLDPEKVGHGTTPLPRSFRSVDAAVPDGDISNSAAPSPARLRSSSVFSMSKPRRPGRRAVWARYKPIRRKPERYPRDSQRQLLSTTVHRRAPTTTSYQDTILPD